MQCSFIISILLLLSIINTFLHPYFLSPSSFLFMVVNKILFIPNNFIFAFFSLFSSDNSFSFEQCIIQNILFDSNFAIRLFAIIF